MSDKSGAINARIWGWGGGWHVARMRKRRDAYRGLVGKPEGRDHLKVLGVGGVIMYN